MHTGSVNGQNINIDVNVSDGDIIRIGQQLCAVAKVEVNYNNVQFVWFKRDNFFPQNLKLFQF